MSTRVRWFLVIILGLMLHFMLTNLTVANLAPYQGNVSYRYGLIPFGYLNYQDAMSVAILEFLLLLILWIVFAVLLLRRSGE